MYRRAPLPLAVSLLLAACSGGGGGGGGGGGVSVPLNGPSTPFTAFSDIDPETLVAFDSQSTVNYQAARDEITGLVATNGTLSQEQTDFDLWVDAATDPAQARLTVGLPVDPDLETDFTTAAVAAGSTDDYIQFSTAGAVAPFSDRLTVYLPDNPADELEYMTFGAWALGMESATANLGGATWGAATPLAGVPDALAPNATYQGGLLGTWIDLGGDVGYYEADSELVANFGAGQVTIASSNTRDLDTGLAQGGLDIFNNAPATIAGNAFTGGSFGVVADGANFGDFGGTFYGPNAEEAGAWFEIESPNFGRYFGTLGGKQ